MKRCLIILFLFLGFDLMAQQDVFMSVKVTDSTYNNPLIGAAIRIQPGDIAGVTDNNGVFSVRLTPDNYLLEVTYLGYETVKRRVEIDTSKHFKIRLSSGRFSLEEITVRSKTPTHLSSDYISQAALESLPAYLGEVDPLKSIQMLPGIVSPSEGNTGLFVRGSDAGQSLVIFDGVPVFNPAHLYNFFSVFNSDILQGITLHKGNIPSLFDSHGSAVLEINSKVANFKTFEMQGGIGLLSSKLFTNIPLVKNRWAIALSGRRTYADLILPVFNPPDLIIKKDGFHFYDLNVIMPVKITKHSGITFSAYKGQDYFNFFDGSSQRFGNQFFSARFNARLSEELPTSMEILLYFTDFSIIYQYYQQGFLQHELKKEHRRNGLQFNFSSSLTSKIQLKYGYQLKWSGYYPTPYYDPNNSNGQELISFQQRSANLHSIYADIAFSLDKLFVETGVRINHYVAKGPAYLAEIERMNGGGLHVLDTLYYPQKERIHNYFLLDPRFSLKYDLSPQWRIFGGGHLVHSPFQSVSTSTVSAPWDYYLLADNKIKPLGVWHFSGGISHNLMKPSLNVKLAGYYKTMKNVAEYKDNIQILDNSPPEFLFSQGKGVAYGTELSVTMNQYRYQGFLSYTLGKVTYEIPDVNRNRPYAPGHDIRHQFTVSQSLKLNSSLILSFQWTYHSGTPIDLPNGIIMVEETPVLYLDQQQKNSDKMPDYHRGDLLLKWTPSKHNQKRWKSSWSFSVYNIYGRKNPFFYRYRDPVGDSFSDYEGYKQDEYTLNPKKVYLFYITPSVSYHFKF